MGYLFGSIEERDERLQNFIRPLRELCQDVLAKLPRDADADYHKSIPEGIIVPTKDQPSAIVIVKGVEPLGLALTRIGRPLFQRDIEPG